MNDGPSLDERLVAAGADPGADPLDAWRRLHAAEGPRATVIDLYELVARPRGLAAHELPAAERHALARSAMPTAWPGWSVTRGSERGGDPLEIVAYDPRWPARFEHWRRVLHTALGATAVRIEHVGSTAVPGLPAKPVIDIQVSVADLDEEALYVPPLERAGLQLRSRDELHRYFRPFPGRPREAHVHVCPAGSVWETEHLTFRDHLRGHPRDRDAYSRAKREAVTRWSDDRIAYTQAKTGTIRHILEKARTHRP